MELEGVETAANWNTQASIQRGRCWVWPRKQEFLNFQERQEIQIFIPIVLSFKTLGRLITAECRGIKVTGSPCFGGNWVTISVQGDRVCFLSEQGKNNQKRKRETWRGLWLILKFLPKHSRVTSNILVRRAGLRSQLFLHSESFVSRLPISKYQP